MWGLHHRSNRVFQMSTYYQYQTVCQHIRDLECNTAYKSNTHFQYNIPHQYQKFVKRIKLLNTNGFKHSIDCQCNTSCQHSTDYQSDTDCQQSTVYQYNTVSEHNIGYQCKRVINIVQFINSQQFSTQYCLSMQNRLSTQ